MICESNLLNKVDKLVEQARNYKASVMHDNKKSTILASQHRLTQAAIFEVNKALSDLRRCTHDDRLEEKDRSPVARKAQSGANKSAGKSGAKSAPVDDSANADSNRSAE